MKFFQKIIVVLLVLTGALYLSFFLINARVHNISEDYIFSEQDNLPNAQTALILGAKVFQDGGMSDMLRDRADTAIELYRNGKVEKFLISGDHGSKEYDEVNAVKNYLLENNIQAEDIFLDHAGFDTYDSLYRAKNIFQVESVIIVTQDFHLPRAVYLGKELGMIVYGVSADRHLYGGIKNNKSREKIANIKAFLDISFSAKPKYSGDAIPISGNSKDSWD